MHVGRSRSITGTSARHIRGGDARYDGWRSVHGEGHGGIAPCHVRHRHIPVASAQPADRSGALPNRWCRYPGDGERRLSTGDGDGDRPIATVGAGGIGHRPLHIDGWWFQDGDGYRDGALAGHIRDQYRIGPSAEPRRVGRTLPTARCRAPVVGIRSHGTGGCHGSGAVAATEAGRIRVRRVGHDGRRLRDGEGDRGITALRIHDEHTVVTGA